LSNNHSTGQGEAEITLGLLKAVGEDADLTQRSAAHELGIALGLVNTYFKRCVKKGLIKVRHAPANRYAYYLTPKGFAEKSRLTGEFLAQSLSLFRQAQRDYQNILESCVTNGWQRIGLCGASDLAEVLTLYARDYQIDVVGVVDSQAVVKNFADLPVVEQPNNLKNVDAFILTDLTNPQSVYEHLLTQIPAERLLIPKLLELSQPTRKKSARTP
jgi:DNA-binding MarR family transcriptional regulator